MKPDPHPWAGDLFQLFVEVWLRLSRSAHDRHAPARYPTLATVTPDGRPQARTVVLRDADKLADTLDIHTDLQSAKVQELRATPFAALHAWDTSAHMQVRLEARVEILTGQDVAAIRASVPEASRMFYGSSPSPGQPIAQALAYTKRPDPASFAALRLNVSTIDALHLGPNHHRTRFYRLGGWAGAWLTP